MQLYQSCTVVTGLSFWRAPKRHFYAIVDTNMVTMGTKRAAVDEGASESKKLKIDNTDLLSSMKKGMDEIKECIADKISETQKTMQEILGVTEKMTIPTGLQRSLMDCFMCKICRNFPMKPPLIFTKCCKAIIGCEACVNQWYSGDEALTKVCRNTRGYNETSSILRFDNFIKDPEVLTKKTSESD